MATRPRSHRRIPAYPHDDDQDVLVWRESKARRRPAGRHATAHRSRRSLLLPVIAGTVVLAGTVVALRPGPDRNVTSVDNGSHTTLRQVTRPVTGPPVTVRTPEGDRYTFATVRGGVDATPLSDLDPPPPGRGYAFIDYVLTNRERHPVLLEFPPNVFLRRTEVPPDYVERCVDQTGASPDVCDSPGRSKLIGRLPGSGGTLRIDADTYLPAGASYLVRAVADPPVALTLTQRDMALYVWQVRFTQDRIARLARFPG